MSTAAEAKEAGSKAWAESKFSDAADHFSTAIEHAKSANDRDLLKVLYSNRSACYLKLGQTSPALLDANSCLGYDSTWPKGLTRKGDALMALKRWDDAQEVFEALLRLSPEDAGIKRKLDQVRASLLQQERSNPFSVPQAQSRLGCEPFSFEDRMSTVHSYLRLAIIAFGAGYMIPWSAISRPCHMMFLLCAVVHYVWFLLNKHGRPAFTRQYAQLLLPDTCTQLLFLAVMQFAAHSYYLAMMPILLGELGQGAPFFVKKISESNPDVMEKAIATVTQYMPQALGITAEQYASMPEGTKWTIFRTMVSYCMLQVWEFLEFLDFLLCDKEQKQSKSKSSVDDVFSPELSELCASAGRSSTTYITFVCGN